MSALLLLAAFLTFAVGLAHSVLGERYVLTRLFRREGALPKLFGGTLFTRRVLRFAWHLTTVAWWGFAAQLVWASGLPRETLAETAAPVLQVIAVTFATSALVTAAASRGRHLAWVVFLAIAVLSGWVGW